MYNEDVKLLGGFMSSMSSNSGNTIPLSSPTTQPANPSATSGTSQIEFSASQKEKLQRCWQYALHYADNAKRHKEDAEKFRNQGGDASWAILAAKNATKASRLAALLGNPKEFDVENASRDIKKLVEKAKEAIKMAGMDAIDANVFAHEAKAGEDAAIAAAAAAELAAAEARRTKEAAASKLAAESAQQANAKENYNPKEGNFKALAEAADKIGQVLAKPDIDKEIENARKEVDRGEKFTVFCPSEESNTIHVLRNYGLGGVTTETITYKDVDDLVEKMKPYVD